MDINHAEYGCDGEFRTSYVKMFVLGTIVTLPCILGGMMESYTSVALGQMKLNINDSSWFGAIPGFVSFVGIIMISFIVDTFGRKQALIFSILPTLCGWMLIFFNNSVRMLLWGRALTGITTGAIFYPAQVYVSECITVNHPHLRSSFVTWGGITNAFGIFLVFVLALIFDYLKIAIIASGIALVLLMIICIFVPESPVWLYLQGRIGDAEMNEKKLGIIQPILRKTCDRKQQFQNVDEMGFEKKLAYFWSGFMKITRKDIYKPLLIISVAVILSNCTGGFVLLSYAMMIIKDNATGKSFLDATTNSTMTNDSSDYLFGAVSGIVILLARFCTAVAFPAFGTKKLTVSSVVVMVIGLLMMGFSGFFDYRISVFNPYYLNVIGLWIASFAFHAGVYSIPLSILSDILPVDAKGFAGVPLIIVAFCASFVVKLHPYLNVDFGRYVFIGYGFMGLVYLVFAIFYLPETVGKTLDQINAEFKSN